jgi:toxin CcdB
MARFSVYAAPDGSGYLLDVQADIMRHLNTRVVVPLIPLGNAPKPASRLNPSFVLNDVEHSMVTQFMAAVRTSELQREIANVAARRDEIVNAIDLLLQGS